MGEGQWGGEYSTRGCRRGGERGVSHRTWGWKGKYGVIMI